MAKDHIVPQTYLRGFASDGSGPQIYDGHKLWDFVKERGYKGYGSNCYIKSVAFEEDFETINEDFETINHGHPEATKVKKFAEKLHRVEDQWPRLRARLELIAEKGRAIDSGLRTDLSDYISCQFVRTSSFRIMWRSGREAVLDREVVQSPADVVGGKLTPEQIKVAHAGILIEGTQERMASDFAAMSWLVGINVTSQPFFTSDNPVAWGLSPHKPSNFIWAFPVTSRLILVMGERNGDCVEVLADEEQIHWYNKFQINFSHKRIFCSIDHREQCRRHCAANPHVCSPDIPEKAGIEMANNDYSKRIAAYLAGGG